MNIQTLPDMAIQNAPCHGALDWVGMGDIALPLILCGQPVQARVDIGVSLDDANTRGIHMSRLYLALGEELGNRPATLPALRQLLQRCLDSHEGLSRSASLELRGELLLERPALVSALSGHKAYPFEIAVRLDPWGFHVELQAEVGYSSTCPCSAALSRQATQNAFAQHFAKRLASFEEVHEWLGSQAGMPATPHSQRSQAHLRVRLTGDELPLVELLDSAEAALGTALQTAVKRADEQAFAIANGDNLLFCEDAARRLDQALKALPWVEAHRLRVVHAESLHAHDAVACASWGWALGGQALMSGAP
ncbi:GTP cyclohydrolase FolE2 [Pseudomonas solani]|uniref:GTP cyclohydrolase FolE2 n=1 Tax=Pseudomonas solani TaxID=2731552 RepID=UPI0003FFCF67